MTTRELIERAREWIANIVLTVGHAERRELLAALDAHLSEPQLTGDPWDFPYRNSAQPDDRKALAEGVHPVVHETLQRECDRLINERDAALAKLAQPDRKALADRLYDCMEQVLAHYRGDAWVDESGDPMPLVDVLTPAGSRSIAEGRHQVRLICDAIYNDPDWCAALAAQPVQEPAGDAPEDCQFQSMPNPSPMDLVDPLFNAIWNATKTWDVNAPEYYNGYCGLNCSQVMLILEAVRAATPTAPVEQPTQAAPIPEVLFDGYAVQFALSPKAQMRTSPESVCDVLDAVVRLLRAAPSAQPKETP